MREETLSVTGMTCGGCVKSVHTVLSSLTGVQQVDVSLEKAQAHVIYDDNCLQHQDLIQAIVDAGFGISNS